METKKRGRPISSNRVNAQRRIDNDLYDRGADSLCPMDKLKLHYETTSESDVINYCMKEVALKLGFID